MTPYWIKTPQIIKRLFSNLVWDMPNTENKIYLTFDDGPTPEVTTWVLQLLKEHNIKATFFCIGKNIVQNSDIYCQILKENHKVGNHTFNHVNGWKTKTDNYLQNIALCENVLATIYEGLNVSKQLEHNKLKQRIFRPPYGKITSLQAKKLIKQGYKIIMWDILSADFDVNISKEKCLENATKKVKSGSIIVFHDSDKAFKNLEYTLPRAITILKEKGFVFDIL